MGRHRRRGLVRGGISLEIGPELLKARASCLLFAVQGVSAQPLLQVPRLPAVMPPCCDDHHSLATDGTRGSD